MQDSGCLRVLVGKTSTAKVAETASNLFIAAGDEIVYMNKRFLIYVKGTYFL